MIKRYLPLIVACVVLVIILILAPWAKVMPLLAHMNPASIVAMAGLAALYYAAKAYRFWVMLKILNIHKPLRRVALIYMAAQPLSILPAGELYRTVLLEQKLGVSKRSSAPTVTLQGLIEAVVLLSFSLTGAFALGRDRVAVVIVAASLALLLVAMRRGWLLGAHRFLNKLPFVDIARGSFKEFMTDHQVLLKSRPLRIVAGLSVIPVVCGVLIFYLAAHAVGADISLGEASIGYSLPVVLSGLSFLPGGIGASEGSTIGLLTLIGIGVAASFAITLLIRVFTLGAGLAFGLVASLLLHLQKD